MPQMPSSNLAPIRQRSKFAIQEEQKISDEEEEEDVGETEVIDHFEEAHRLPHASDGQVHVNIAIEEELVFKQQVKLANGNVYTGHFLDELPHGFGIEESTKGDRYEGFFERGQRSGHGKLVSKDGREYDGEFREGKMHGHGVLLDPSGC